MIITTTSTIEGRPVRDYLGLVGGEVIVGADIFKDVFASIRDIVGEDYALGIELDMDTSFAEDLELESIEFVRLGEKLQEHYGEKVDLVAWFAEFDVDQIINLTVGELVDYIRRSVA